MRTTQKSLSSHRARACVYVVHRGYRKIKRLFKKKLLFFCRAKPRAVLSRVERDVVSTMEKNTRVKFLGFHTV